MKTTKSKTKVNSEKGSTSTIKNFFKADPKECNERPPHTTVKSVYVHALLDKLKSKNFLTLQSDARSFLSENFPNVCSTKYYPLLMTLHELSTIFLIHFHNDIGFDDGDAPNIEVELAQGKSETVNTAPTTQSSANGAEKDKSSRCEACGRVDKSDGCGECDKWQKKYEDVKKSHIKLSVRYTELMMKYDELVEVAKGTVRPNVNSETDEPQISSIANRIASQTLSLSDGAAQSLCQPDDIFTENEIKCLKCLPLDKNKDSTFILNCLQYAYKNNAASIAMKTLKGTRGRYEVSDSGDLVEVKAGKDPLTPEKVHRIKQLFMDRVTKSKCMAVEFGERVKEIYFNRLIASAVKNISNKAAPSKKPPPNKNDDLNL